MLLVATSAFSWCSCCDSSQQFPFLSHFHSHQVHHQAFSSSASILLLLSSGGEGSSRATHRMTAKHRDRCDSANDANRGCKPPVSCHQHISGAVAVFSRHSALSPSLRSPAHFLLPGGCPKLAALALKLGFGIADHTKT